MLGQGRCKTSLQNEYYMFAVENIALIQLAIFDFKVYLLLLIVEVLGRVFLQPEKNILELRIVNINIKVGINYNKKIPAK